MGKLIKIDFPRKGRPIQQTVREVEDTLYKQFCTQEEYGICECPTCKRTQNTIILVFGTLVAALIGLGIYLVFFAFGG